MSNCPSFINRNGSVSIVVLVLNSKNGEASFPINIRTKFGGWADQDYLSNEVKNAEFYKPIIAGSEKKFAGIYDKLKSFRKK